MSDDIKNYMAALNTFGKSFRKVSSGERKQTFEQLTRGSPCFEGNRFLLRGLKGAFGLTDDHRNKISAAIRGE